MALKEYIESLSRIREKMTSFNKKLSALAVGAAVFVSASVHAATDTTLTVEGKFVPAACSPVLGDSGKVDFGSMSTAMLNKATDSTGLVQLERKKINLTITCDAATSVAILAQDNRTSSKVAVGADAYIEDYAGLGANMMTTGAVFGLGTTTDGKSIGSYTITAIAAELLVDGNPAAIILKDLDQGTGGWTSTSGGLFYPDQTRYISVAEKATKVPKYFTEMTVPLYIAAAVQTKDKLGAGTEVTLDGNATISLVYL